MSHVLIWHRGDQGRTEATCLEMLDQVKAIHLSHNNERANAHDLIPTEIWFASYLNDWKKRYFVTYKSLPETQANYERLDKRRR